MELKPKVTGQAATLAFEIEAYGFGAVLAVEGPQKPEKRAIERNEDAVRSWKRSTWPALKKKPSEKAG